MGVDASRHSPQAPRSTGGDAAQTSLDQKNQDSRLTQPSDPDARNQRFLGPIYHRPLKVHGVARIYDHWTHVPPLVERHRGLSGEFTTPFVVLRLLTPLPMKSEAAVKLAKPYNKIAIPLPECGTIRCGWSVRR